MAEQLGQQQHQKAGANYKTTQTLARVFIGFLNVG